MYISAKTPQSSMPPPYLKKISAPLIVCLLGMGSAAAETESSVKKTESATVMEQQSMRPMWIVSDFKLTNQSQWTEHEAQQWLFKSLELTPEIIRFNEQVCKSPQLLPESISLGELLAWTGGLSGDDLKIPDGPLQLVRTGCKLDGMDQFIRLPNRRLLIQAHKVVFILEPNVNY